jgi:prepilin-type processing-associated H-X9-DG protein
VTKVSSLLCPTESANQALFPVNTGANTYYYAVSSYVGNYGGPAAIVPYNGTIIPEYDVEQGMNMSSVRLPSVGIQTVTDGTSNTGLFSERLLAGYPFGSTATVYPSGIPGLRAIFTGTYAAAPSSVTPANMFNANPAQLFAQGCQGLSSTVASPYPAAIGVEMIAGNPGYVGLASYNHWTTPNTVPCQNSLDPIVGWVGPYGSASATSLHPGGVNLCFADGSVHFIKNSIAYQPWWGLGSRSGGEVVSSDQY